MIKKMWGEGCGISDIGKIEMIKKINEIIDWINKNEKKRIYMENSVPFIDIMFDQNTSFEDQNKIINEEIERTKSEKLDNDSWWEEYGERVSKLSWETERKMRLAFYFGWNRGYGKCYTTHKLQGE